MFLLFYKSWMVGRSLKKSRNSALMRKYLLYRAHVQDVYHILLIFSQIKEKPKYRAGRWRRQRRWMKNVAQWTYHTCTMAEQEPVSELVSEACLKWKPACPAVWRHNCSGFWRERTKDEHRKVDRGPFQFSHLAFAHCCNRDCRRSNSFASHCRFIWCVS